MKKLLLVSTSATWETRYLDHCIEEMGRTLGAVRRLLFVPFALADRAGYAARARARFAEVGVAVDALHEAADPVAAVERADAVFVGGGNTFRLLAAVEELGLVEPLRRRALSGMPYLGTSAGSNLACPTIMTTNDMPIVQPRSFGALGLVSFQINPHYLDPEPGSRHMGETRETRIVEYLEENDRTVVGLREGAMLRVDERGTHLLGSAGARIFRRGRAPEEVVPGTRLDPWIGQEQSFSA